LPWVNIYFKTILVTKRYSSWINVLKWLFKQNLSLLNYKSLDKYYDAYFFSNKMHFVPDACLKIKALLVYSKIIMLHLWDNMLMIIMVKFIHNL
jgi:hypothetical protein